jgi:hypothetical protein
MRPIVLAGAAVVAASFLIHPTRTAAISSWCYYNEEVHCTEVSFETCHFATFGNGGYCFPNPHFRRYVRPEPVEPVRGGSGYYGWHDNWWPVEYGYPGFRGHQQIIATGLGYGWCYGPARCGAQPFETIHS